MISERERTLVDRGVPLLAASVEMRQDPHAMPAVLGGLQQDFVLPENENMSLDQAFCFRP